MFSKSHNSNTRSASFTHRMTASTIVSTISHYTSNLTTEKSIHLPFTEQDTLFWYLLSVPEKGLLHDSHSPGATNTQKCESPFGFDEFLPNLAYVGEIANETLCCSCSHGLSSRQNAASVLQLNDIHCYDLFSIQNIFFTTVVFCAQTSVAFTTYHSYVKEAFSSIINCTRSTILVKRSILLHTFMLGAWTKTDHLSLPHDFLFMQ